MPGKTSPSPIAPAAYKSKSDRFCGKFHRYRISDETMNVANMGLRQGAGKRSTAFAVTYGALMRNAVIRKFRALMAAKQSRGQFWKSVPPGSLALFQVAIFSLFASLGFVALM